LARLARYWLVMPAAGAGRRFGSDVPKQYAELCGRFVIEWALRPFLDDPACEGVVVALSAEDRWWPQVEGRWPRHRPAARLAPGGAERCASVANALTVLADAPPPAQQDPWVLVHDAARPCVTAAEIDRLRAGGLAGGQGAVLAAPLADTLKRARTAVQRIAETVPRAGLWQAQTPQMFRCGALRAALRTAAAAGRQPTDEAQAMEWVGGEITLVEGESTNIKVTTAADLRLAAAILAARGEA
jgi:2-C-methyl-D-erythritol 4-phosphate cytidylyltransferase